MVDEHILHEKNYTREFESFLHISRPWWLFTDRDNDAHSQFITPCEFCDVPLEAAVINSVVQKTYRHLCW